MKTSDWLVVGVLGAVAVVAVVASLGAIIYAAVQSARRPPPRHKS